MKTTSNLWRAFVLTALFLCVTTSGPSREGGFTFQKNVMIAMSDGTELAANLFLPKEGELFPTILMRTPYGKGSKTNGQARAYVSKGYAVIIQDCRGRGDSKGIWDPFRYDADDGFVTQEWVGKQSWSNGKIGTAGGSYVGWSQWASAPKGSQYLTAMVPQVPFCNAYDLAYDGGAFQISLLMGWGANVGGVKLDPEQQQQAFRYLPLNKYDDQFDKEVFYLTDWIDHPAFDDYWEQRGIGRDGFENITVPILNIGGWYDIFSKVTLDMINGVRKKSSSEIARRNQFAVLGPWGHGVGVRKVGDLDFGEAAALNIGELQFKWFEHWLKQKDTGIEDWPRFYLFVMGENVWRGEEEWPLKRTQYTPWYLHSGGDANDPDGSGMLSLGKSELGKVDSFVYDPDNPAPTMGGNNLGGAPIGPYDQSEVEKRDDILVYTSEPLKQAVEVTGTVKMILYAATSAKDTDFTAKLVDVHPDGKAYNLCDGIIRARWRNSRSKAELVEPGEIIKYEIDLWVTSNLFKAGHQIRVEISSSNFPRFDRNANSGGPFGADTKLFKASQTIHHDAEHASHILLPVIPR
ncbi:MAG: CocE/NonD family hydrolase [Verrucomicrobiota bacterium]